MKRRWIFPVAVPGLAALALAGCGSTGSAPQAATATTASVPTPTSTSTTATTTAPTSTTTAPASTTTSAPTTPPTSVAATASVSACTTAELAASLGQANGAAGSAYYPLQFTDIGSSPCTLQGFPGVSFVAGSGGTQVGASAQRVSGPEPVVTLHPGGPAASALLRVVVAGNFPSSCKLTNVRGLRVYPPNQTAALFVPHPDQGCANPADVTLAIQPVAG